MRMRLDRHHVLHYRELCNLQCLSCLHSFFKYAEQSDCIVLILRSRMSRADRTKVDRALERLLPRPISELILIAPYNCIAKCEAWSIVIV